MGLPRPVPGQVIRYGYLWRDEARRGRDEGVKDRPCVVVLAVEEAGVDLIVYVAPVTHSPPRKSDEAVELPAATKRRLGMDGAPSWIVSTELNRFVWPGPDLRPIPGRSPQTVVYGFIPGTLLRRLRDQIVAHGRLSATRRA